MGISDLRRDDVLSVHTIQSEIIFEAAFKHVNKVVKKWTQVVVLTHEVASYRTFSFKMH